jgi:hypothetical protein
VVFHRYCVSPKAAISGSFFKLITYLMYPLYPRRE